MRVSLALFSIQTIAILVISTGAAYAVTVMTTVDTSAHTVRLDFTDLPPYTQIRLNGVSALYWCNCLDNDNPSSMLSSGFIKQPPNALEMQYEGPTPPSTNFIVYHYIHGSAFVGVESVEWIKVSLADEGDLDLVGDRPIIFPDTDSDGILDDGDLSGIAGDNVCSSGNTVSCDDNCALDQNSTQLDTDNDGQGDVCDSDDDADGHNDATENAIGTDPLDPDTDDDGVCDGPALPGGCSLSGPDNCPVIPNPDQADSNGNGIGDVCETANLPVVSTLGRLALGALMLGAGVLSSYRAEPGRSSR